MLERFRSGAEVRMALQHGRFIIEVRWESLSRQSGEPLPEAGSRVRVTGVHDVDYNDRAEAVGFHLLIGQRDQIELLAPPRWWTRERVLVAGGLLLGCVVVALFWVGQLRRRVTVQTREINEQMQRTSKLTEDLQRASRLESLGTLAGGIAHDFNNLLTVMMGNASLVATEDTLSAETRDRLDDTRKAAMRARDLTHRLITFAKGGAPVRAAVDVEALLRDEVERFVVGPNTVWEWRVSAALPEVYADHRQIRPVVQNMLLNAVQAMPRGGLLRMELTAETVSEDGDTLLSPGNYVRWEWRDSGEGIVAKNLGRVFDPYFTTRTDTHGLGLAVVYSIVRRHRGRVSIESTPMVGTEARIWLPVFDPTRDV
ncbi:MAG: hypothetical protein J6386_06435 [Candidatus Synoicihabitans palmerolidicus]|nr:hypothetical protein [Candidatus Synoicihabitans palmerolidicus]